MIYMFCTNSERENVFNNKKEKADILGFCKFCLYVAFSNERSRLVINCDSIKELSFLAVSKSPNPVQTTFSISTVLSYAHTAENLIRPRLLQVLSM